MQKQNSISVVEGGEGGIENEERSGPEAPKVEDFGHSVIGRHLETGSVVLTRCEKATGRKNNSQ